ncbi:MAG: XdhC family protein, partial [Acidobacteriota bacterium]
MNKELEIWQFAAERLKRDESVMLLVVAESSGSSPGRQGFKMIVARDELCGSIGGGVMEVALVELAKGERRKAKGENKSVIIEQVHRKNSPHSSGMICSGKQTVIFFELNPAHLKTIQNTANSLETFQPKTLRISNAEIQIGDIQIEDFDFRFEQSNENEFIYKEKIGYKNNLYIIGGGHCALALSESMSKMDFHISLFDDRADLNTLAKNKFVHHKQTINSYENIGDFIESGANVYVVVMTLGYKFDE